MNTERRGMPLWLIPCLLALPWIALAAAGTLIYGKTVLDLVRVLVKLAVVR